MQLLTAETDHGSESMNLIRSSVTHTLPGTEIWCIGGRLAGERTAGHSLLKADLMLAASLWRLHAVMKTLAACASIEQLDSRYALPDLRCN